jgi:hypothetical protein
VAVVAIDAIKNTNYCKLGTYNFDKPHDSAVQNANSELTRKLLILSALFRRPKAGPCFDCHQNKSDYGFLSPDRLTTPKSQCEHGMKTKSLFFFQEPKHSVGCVLTSIQHEQARNCWWMLCAFKV